MNRKVDIWIESVADSGIYTKIDLFNDESINVSSTIQNIQDISKVFTDFTQSFSVPASPINNRIFEHFYQNDVNTSLNHNLRRNAYIEIDLTPFRTGKIQLEKSTLKNGQVESYQITFYGEMLSLKDKFGDAKLKDLDLTSYSHAYTGDEVKNRITLTTDYDVRYPLISSKRLWSYGDSTSTDISTTSGKIDFQELSPAIKIVRLFEAIETMFNIDFQGVFLSDKRFTNCFLFCKNTEVQSFIVGPLIVDVSIYNTNGTTSTNDTLSFSPFDATNDIINIDYITITDQINDYHNVNLSFYCSSLTATVYIDIYENGILVNTLTGSGATQSYNVLNKSNVTGLNIDLQCKFRATEICTFSDIYYSYDYVCQRPINGDDYTSLYDGTIINYSNTDSQTLSTNINISQFIPDMKIYDFVSGVLKEFNLTCYPLSTSVFQVEPLDSWYKKGGAIDITKYTDLEAIEIERVKLYKNISFKYQESQSFMNVEFKSLYGREYGNLTQAYQYDGDDYQVQVPFENLLFNKFTATDLQVGYCLTPAPDFKSYLPKPILLYLYESKSCNFKIQGTSTTHTLTSYMPFGQDVNSINQNYSLNFGNDNSSLLDVPINNSLFSTYYYPYLGNLFNKKNRITKVKTILPISLLTKLRLNDRLIIRDKRYFINQMNSNITNGEVNFELLHDLSEVKNAGIFKPAKPGGTIGIPILMKNSVVSIALSSSTLTFSTSTVTSEQIVDVTYPTSTEAVEPRITEASDYRITEDGQRRITETGNTLSHVIQLDETYENGDTATDYIYLIQEL